MASARPQNLLKLVVALVAAAFVVGALLYVAFMVFV